MSSEAPEEDIPSAADYEQQLLDEDTGVAESASQALCNLASSPKGLTALLGKETGDSACAVGRLLQRLKDVSDIHQVRILHFFVDLGRKSEKCFQALKERGAYKKVLESFFTDDILLKLNAVELMDALGSFPAGQELLSHEGVPEKLARELSDPMNDMAVHLCVTRLLGTILMRNPSTASSLLVEKTRPFPAMLGLLLESTDIAQRLCGLNAWADACVHADGLAFFLQWPQLVDHVVSSIESTNNEICKGGMAAWSAVLRSYDVPPETAEVSQSQGPARALWELADQKVSRPVLKVLAAKPFQDVRQETWRLLAILGRSKPILQKLMSAEEVRERLLDFGSETTYEAKIAKHEFVTEVLKLHGNWLSSFLDDNVESMLIRYANEGPTWMPREANMLVNQGAA